MAFVKGNYQSIMTGGWWITDAGGGDTPAEPTLTILNDGDGDAVTATVDGDADVTNYLLYRTLTGTTWTVGSDREGDGEIAQAGLDADTAYWFIAVSKSGDYYSIPSVPVYLYVTGGGTKTYEIVGLQLIDEAGGEWDILATELE